MGGRMGMKQIGMLGVLALGVGLLTACGGVAQGDFDAAKAQLATAQQQLATVQQESAKTKQDLQAAQQQVTKLTQDIKAAAIVRNDKEVQNLNTVRPSLAATLDALNAGDVAKARSVFDSLSPSDYNTVWHGMETYINFRFNPLYGELETVHQAKLTALLNDPKATNADMVKEAKIMLALWDAMMAQDKLSPAISPAFEDLAAIRLLKAQTLTLITADLKAGDVATSKALYTQFANKWADVEDMIHERSADVYAAIEGAMTPVNTAFQKSSPSAAELTPLVATLLVEFNKGQALVNATARYADLTKTAYTNDDVQGAAVLTSIMSELTAAQASWKAGNYADSGTRAKNANGALLAKVAAALKAKTPSADAALKTALDNYAALADKAGDATTVGAAQAAAVQAARVAQQVMVGQFWTDTKLQTAILQASATIK